MSRESDAEFRRKLERELDHAAWRSVRPLFLAMLLVLVSIWAISSKAAEPLQLSCNPRAQEFDIEGKPTTITAYEVFSGLAANALQPLAKVQTCSYDASSTAPGKWFFAWRQYNAVGPSQLGPVSSFTVAAVPKQLLTVGGPVYVATPNYTNFTWKLGAQAGTIAPKIKCDVTRKIGDDFFRVTAPIVWTNGKKNYVVARCEQV